MSSHSAWRTYSNGLSTDFLGKRAGAGQRAEVRSVDFSDYERSPANQGRARSQGYGWLLFRAQGALGSGIGRKTPDLFLSTGRIASVPVLTGPKQQVAVVAFFAWVDNSVAATAGFNFAVSIAAIPENQVAVVALLARLHDPIAAVAGLMLEYPTAQVVATPPVELHATIVIAAVPRSSVPVVAALTRIEKPVSAGQRPGRWRRCAVGAICSPSRIGDGNAISTPRT